MTFPLSFPLVFYFCHSSYPFLYRYLSFSLHLFRSLHVVISRSLYSFPAPSISLFFSVPFCLVLSLYHLSVSLVIFIFLSLYLHLCLSFPLILYYFHSPYIFFSAVFRNRFMCRNVPPSFCKCRIAHANATIFRQLPPSVCKCRITQANATIFRQLPPSFWVCRSTQATQPPSKMPPFYV